MFWTKKNKPDKQSKASKGGLKASGGSVGTTDKGHRQGNSERVADEIRLLMGENETRH